MLANGSRVELEVPLKQTKLSLHAVVVKWSPSIIETTAPCLNGQRFSFPVGTPVDVKETCEDSVLILHSRLEGIRNGSHLRWILGMPGFDGIERIQRRTHVRYSIHAQCFIQSHSHLVCPEHKVIQIRDISSGGALIGLNRKLELGENLLLNLSPVLRPEVAEAISELVAKARVVRLACKEQSHYGVTFDGFGKIERLLLNKSLMEQMDQVGVSRADCGCDR